MQGKPAGSRLKHRPAGTFGNDFNGWTRALPKPVSRLQIQHRISLDLGYHGKIWISMVHLWEISPKSGVFDVAAVVFVRKTAAQLVRAKTQARDESN
jgi:hypothetical protein